MKNKNKLNALRKGYFKLPNKIVDMNLSAVALALYSYLAKNSEEFNPSVKTMANALNISKGTVIKYLQELKDRNIIKVIEIGRERVTTKYEFVDVKEWM